MEVKDDERPLPGFVGQRFVPGRVAGVGERAQSRHLRADELESVKDADRTLVAAGGLAEVASLVCDVAKIAPDRSF